MTSVIQRTAQCLLIHKETTTTIGLLKTYNHALKVPELMVKRGSRKIAKGAFHIKLLTQSDKQPSLDFLKRLFFRDEPVAKAVKLLDGPNDRCVELEEYISKAIDDGISVKAVDDNGDLVGVIINSLLHRKNVVNKEEIEKIPNPKFKRIIRFLAHLEVECRLWEKVPSNCDTVVDLKVASTDPKWRGRNIMKKLVEETERVAKEKGAAGVHLVATSVFSTKAVERLGYKKIFCIKYAEMPEGPQPEPPHLEACVFFKLFEISR